MNLNGQVKDSAFTLGEIARRYSAGKSLLIIFGNSASSEVNSFKAKSLEMLQAMAGRGSKVAILHIDTAVYRDGPRTMVDESERPFVEPSALIYVNGVQLHYVKEFSDRKLQFIESAIVISEKKFLERAK